ncbi:MAG: ElyC/SanA/YdcF family protein [Alkalispirochaeta sp.]
MFRVLLIVRHLIKYGVLLVLLAVFLSHSLVRGAAEGRVYSEISEVPVSSAALVLGTSRYSRSGTPNRFFVARMDAAADLVEEGRVEVLVVSGDNSHSSYNEPAAMADALRERGVSSDRIVRDYAGFRTLDSVIRMRSVFQQDRFVIVSQRFHVERAIFIAAAHRIDAYAYAADDASGMAQLNVRVREYAARVQAVLDVYVFNTEPRFTGPSLPIEFPISSPLNSRS